MSVSGGNAEVAAAAPPAWADAAEASPVPGVLAPGAVVAVAGAAEGVMRMGGGRSCEGGGDAMLVFAWGGDGQQVLEGSSCVWC